MKAEKDKCVINRHDDVSVYFLTMYVQRNNKSQNIVYLYVRS